MFSQLMVFWSVAAKACTLDTCYLKCDRTPHRDSTSFMLNRHLT
ncbi:hypothetical protein [Tychonema sp. LEGE 07203]|nr:hypothetical protein [Tychonema sp. LEGE 07203]